MSTPQSKFLVVNADDFGLAPKTNDAILDAHKKGILTSTSLLATCPGFDHAVKKVRNSEMLAVGIHLSLTLGVPVLHVNAVSHLVSGRGTFNPKFGYYLIRHSRELMQQIESEFKAQIEKILRSGIKPYHIDSQSHIHMIPPIFRIVIQLARIYRIPFVRLAKDRMYSTGTLAESVQPFINVNIIKLMLLNSLAVSDRNALVASSPKVRTADDYYGVFHTGNVNVPVIHAILSRLRPGVTELSLHPGNSVNDTDFDFSSQYMHDFMVSPTRLIELYALKDKNVLLQVRRHDIILTNYKKLSL